MSRSVLVLAALVGALLLPAHAGAATGQDGPGLRVPADALTHALNCSDGLEHARENPVLLLPGTTLTPEEFSWNYVPALRAMGRPYCTVTLPDNGMADIQVASEYVVHAIRTTHAESGRKVDILGHSQGGMVPRWALKYWPDTRGMVDDLVGLSPSNHGTLVANAICAPGCAPAFYQQRKQSGFMKALNAGPETWSGIDYTNAYTQLDEVVAPNFNEAGSSSLRTGAGEIRNIALQEICPAHVAEHITTGTSDPVGYALAIDALTHEGPAEPARISRQVCARPFMPFVDPVRFPANEAALLGTVASQLALYPHVPFEPASAEYVEDRRPGVRDTQ